MSQMSSNVQGFEDGETHWLCKRGSSRRLAHQALELSLFCDSLGVRRLCIPPDSVALKGHLDRTGNENSILLLVIGNMPDFFGRRN